LTPPTPPTSRLIDNPGLCAASHTAAASFLENATRITDLIFGSVCHRFPRLRFVSVERGAGWAPSVLDALDCQWQNGGVWREHPEYDLPPSQCFGPQIYGCFWFERQGIRTALELFPDSQRYETDLQHPTCMAPGPQSRDALRPRDHTE
jgi:hypothetical protein